tara:strand:- start:534 stop:1247 length:714 start_codon:yes stop_codon:yes gene_type:complete
MTYLKNLAILIFDLIDHYIHQKNIIKALKKEKLKIEIFFDIGAHKGKYTDLILKEYNIKKAYLFEPQVKMFNFIKEKYKDKNFINVNSQGVSNKTESVSFYINKHNLTSSLKKLNPKNKYLNLKSKLFNTSLDGMIENNLDIKTIKLNEFFLENNILNVDLIKIDTEGHEYEVLAGLEGKIKFIKAFLIEFHDDHTYLNYSSNKIENILLKNNFFLKKKIKFPFTTWEDRLYLNNDI